MAARGRADAGGDAEVGELAAFGGHAGKQLPADEAASSVWGMGLNEENSFDIFLDMVNFEDI